MYRKVLKNPNNLSMRAAFNIFRNKLNKSLRLAENTYYRNKLLSFTNDSKNLWKTYAEIMN